MVNFISYFDKFHGVRNIIVSSTNGKSLRVVVLWQIWLGYIGLLGIIFE